MTVLQEAWLGRVLKPRSWSELCRAVGKPHQSGEESGGRSGRLTYLELELAASWLAPAIQDEAGADDNEADEEEGSDDSVVQTSQKPAPSTPGMSLYTLTFENFCRNGAGAVRGW
jgi:hypothetical protein